MSPLANRSAYFARDFYAIEVEVYNPDTDRTETLYYSTDGFTALLDLVTASVEVFPSPLFLRLVGDTASVEVTPTPIALDIDADVVTVEVTPRCVGLTLRAPSAFTSGGGQLRAAALVGANPNPTTASLTIGPPALAATGAVTEPPPPPPPPVCNTSLSGSEDFGEDWCAYTTDADALTAYNWAEYP